MIKKVKEHTGFDCLLRAIILLLSILWVIIQNQAVILEIKSTKKELDSATSELGAKKIIALKAEVDKLDIDKFVNVPTSLNNLKTKVEDLGVCKLKTIPVALKKLNDVVDNEVVKNTKFNTLKTKVNNLEKNILPATTLIHINQYNIDKQNLEKKVGGVDKKNTRYEWFSDYNLFEFKN